jgi:thiamine biosynthesis lipoprotein ApbE
MKIINVAGAALFLGSQFLCLAQAMELCEAQDYYNLANATKCSIQYDKTGNKADPQSAMFEIMKNYPFENRDVLVRLLQRKIELIDNYKAQQQVQGETERVKANISKLEQTKQGLSEQIVMINAATQDDWFSVRDRASKVLEEAAKRLREVE